MLTPREFGAILRAGRTAVTRSLHDGYLTQAAAWALVDAQLSHLATTTYSLPRLRLERMLASQLAKTINPEGLEWHQSTFPAAERQRGHTATILGPSTRPQRTPKMGTKRSAATKPRRAQQEPQQKLQK